MKTHPVSVISGFFCGFVLVIGGAFTPGNAQDLDPEVRDAYFRAVAQYFEVPVEEVSIVGDWDLAPDEVPVVLFIAGHAGVSPDALIGLRRRGHSWQTVARQLGLGNRTFHIPLPESEALGSLGRAYGEFRTRHPREWNSIELQDPDIVFMVNIRVLSAQVEVPPIRVLRVRDEAGSFAAGFIMLLDAALRT